MIELVSTSLPNGLLPGTHGFATVGMTRGTPDNTRTLLEGLSSYIHRASGHDARYKTDNPVAWHHVAPPRGGHVLSRVAVCDFDYTGRTNRLARHWQADDAEWPSGCNAARALLENRGWFEAPWEGEARWLAAGDASRLSAGGAGEKAGRWVALYGEKGRAWAERLAADLGRQLASGAGKPLVVATSPTWDPDGTKLLVLFADLIDLLPERVRAKATFSTYAAVLPGWVPCALRGLMPDDPSLAVLTAGRPWFDATTGTLQREELLSTLAAEPGGRGTPRMAMRPTGSHGGGGVSKAGEDRPSGAMTGGMIGTGRVAPSGRHRKGRGAEVAFFGLLAAVLLATAGYLVWMVWKGQPLEMPEPVVQSDEPTETGEATENEEGTEEGEEPVAVPEAEPVAVEEEVEGKEEEEAKEEVSPTAPPRLWDGATWRENKPLPGEEGVEWWYYPEGADAMVKKDAQSFSGSIGTFWREVPETHTVLIWKDAKNRAFWEFESPNGVEVPGHKGEEVDWRRFWLGPDERLWQEWEEETRGKARQVQFNVEVVLQTMPYAFSNSWKRDALSDYPVAIASFWDEAWNEACRQWREHDNTIEARKKDIGDKIAALEQEKKEIPEKLQTAQREVKRLEDRLSELQKKAHERWQLQIDDMDREYRSMTEKTTAERQRKEKMRRQLEQFKKSSPPVTPEQEELQRKIAKCQNFITSAGQRAEAMDKHIQAYEKEREEMHPLVSESGQEKTAREMIEKEGKMRVTLAVKVGENVEVPE